MNRLKRLSPLLLVSGGLLLILAAFFAQQLGLDNNDHWGFGRYALVAAGQALWLILGWLATPALHRQLVDKLLGFFGWFD
jgi:hypothetical protein